MDDKQIRIKRLKSQITAIHQTCYPDGYEEVKQVMLEALRERVFMLENVDPMDQEYLPVSQRG